MPSKNPRPVADHEFDTLSSETVYLGKILALRLDEVAMPGGGTARREVVEHFGAVAVVALDDDDAVTLVEWGEAILPALPPEYLEVRLELGEDDDERLLELVMIGRRWAARSVGIARAVGPWAA